MILRCTYGGNVVYIPEQFLAYSYRVGSDKYLVVFPGNEVYSILDRSERVEYSEITTTRCTQVTISDVWSSITSQLATTHIACTTPYADELLVNVFGIKRLATRGTGTTITLSDHESVFTSMSISAVRSAIDAIVSASPSGGLDYQQIKRLIYLEP